MVVFTMSFLWQSYITKAIERILMGRRHVIIIRENVKSRRLRNKEGRFKTYEVGDCIGLIKESVIFNNLLDSLSERVYHNQCCQN